MGTMSHLDLLGISPDAVSFFHEHAGYSYDPATETPEQGRARCAIALAEAEHAAAERDWVFEWKADWTVGSHRDYYGADSAYADSEPDTCETCILYSANGVDVLGSLGCIDDATDDYRRVVQAELAAEAMAEAEAMADKARDDRAAEGEQALAVRAAAEAAMDAAAVQVISVGGWTDDPINAGVPQRVYGELLRLALPVVNHYLSDLYHDAVWLSRNVTDDTTVTFFYAVRDCGTHLVSDIDYIQAVKSVSPESVIYSAAIVCDERGAWSLVLSRCDRI